MRKHDFFRYERFAGYLKKLFTESWRANLVRTVLLFATMLVVELWTAITIYPNYYDAEGKLLTDYRMDYDPAFITLWPILAFLFLAVGCFMSSRFLHDGQRKSERIAMLTTPVSTFENWLARWILHVPAVIVVFFGCLYLADALRVAIFTPVYPELPISLFKITGSNYSLEEVVPMFILYFLCTSLYLLGGVFFPRRAILTTSIVLFFVAWFYVFIGFSSLDFFNEEPGYDYSPGKLLMWAYLCVATLFCWWLSYRRLKELEVIDRL
ncbi:hypothetical protein [Prevotella sp. KH2C16]|uniref:hypothetical protein n=1 Tax=Prevotella sp. KH2C16 TaxID=1855325 RepID=UPI0008ED5DEE|nr:hypothetical protein [Prevotella sp. KH2C16]SFG49787.1 hypothetical protein SAMN05216383_11720 [Prevotella sp. KH2C16]